MAVKAYARTLAAGKEIALDAGEIILRADARLGELARALPKASPDRKSKSGARTLIPAKATALAAVGVTKQRATEFEKVASLPAEDLDAYVKPERKAGRAPTTGGARSASRKAAAAHSPHEAKLDTFPGS